MIEKLIDLLANGWHYIAPFVVLEPYEGGGVLRFGRYHRTIGCGFSWKWPLAEVVISVPTCTTTMRIPPQTLTTRDGVGVVCGGVIKYQIKDVEPYICGVLDQVDVLADTTMGAILSAVTDADYETLRADLAGAARRARQRVADQVNRFGFKVEAITFTDFGKVRSFRLVSEHAANIAN